MLSFEHANLCFLFGEDFTRTLQLALKKLRGVFGLLLAYFQIFVNEEVGQFAGNLLGNVGSRAE